MNKIELPDFMAYKNKFTANGFVEKISRVAKRAGAKFVYAALILFYTLESDKVSLKEKAIIAVEKAVSERKIAPASKDAYLAMCASEEGLANFAKIMESTPAIIPAGVSAAAGTPPASEMHTELNAEELNMCKAMGYTKEEWLKIKEGK